MKNISDVRFAAILVKMSNKSLHFLENV